MEYNKRFVRFGHNHIKINHVSYYSEELKLDVADKCIIMLTNGTYASSTSKSECNEMKKILGIEQPIFNDGREV